MKIFFLALVIFGGLILSLFHIWPVSAGVSINLRPVKFILDIKPGDSYEDAIILVNNADETATLQSEVQDFIPTGEANINFVPRAGEGTSLVDWIDISKEPFTIGPKEEKRVPFTIRVPGSGAPGGHFAVIFFNALPPAAGEGAAVGITTRIGSLVMVGVPGAISRGGNIESFTGPKIVENGPLGFRVKFYNSGSVHYRPEGTLKIKNLLDKVVAQGVVNSQYVFPKTSRTFNAVVESNQFFWGPNTAMVELKDGEGKTSSATLKFWGLPWRVTFVPVLGLALAIIAIIEIKKRFKFSISKR